MLYIAYGSNLHKGQMKGRCPGATAVGAAVIPNTRLVFRGVADIEPAPGESCNVGIWHITRACERELDVYEGVRHGLYRKEYLPLKVKRNGKETVEQGLVYVMNSRSYSEPSQSYYNCIETGYKNFGIPVDELRQAAIDNHARVKADRALAVAASKGGVKVEFDEHATLAESPRRRNRRLSAQEWDGPLNDIADQEEVWDQAYNEARRAGAGMLDAAAVANGTTTLDRLFPDGTTS